MVILKSCIILYTLHLRYAVATSGWSWRWNSGCHSGTWAPDRPPSSHIGLKRMQPFWGSKLRWAMEEFENKTHLWALHWKVTNKLQLHLTHAWHENRESKKKKTDTWVWKQRESREALVNFTMKTFTDHSLKHNSCKANETGNLCAISNEY